MFDIRTAQWVIWGAKRPYNTFGHIHEAFLRALQYMGRPVFWLDNGDDTSYIDFTNTVFLTMNTVVHGMPQRKDSFYICHNIFGDQNLPYFDGLKLLGTGVHITPNVYSPYVEIIGPDIYFEPDNRSLQMRWGTDLLPHEIMANKPKDRVFNADSQVVNYIGTVDHQKMPSIRRFSETCSQNGIRFETYGGFNGGRNVSIEEHVQLIKDSFMAPAFQGQDQIDTGYVSCRLFKNISAGQYGITQSKYANEIFGGRLIFNENPVDLFYDARDRLRDMPLKDLYDLMDDVATNHTYLNKVKAIEHAVRTLENI